MKNSVWVNLFLIYITGIFGIWYFPTGMTSVTGDMTDLRVSLCPDYSHLTVCLQTATPQTDHKKLSDSWHFSFSFISDYFWVTHGWTTPQLDLKYDGDPSTHFATSNSRLSQTHFATHSGQPGLEPRPSSGSTLSFVIWILGRVNRQTAPKIIKILLTPSVMTCLFLTDDLFNGLQLDWKQSQALNNKLCAEGYTEVPNL